MEIRNELIVTSGKGGGGRIMGERRGRVKSRNKDSRTKTIGRWGID